MKMEIILKNRLSHFRNGLGFSRPMRTGAPFFSEKRLRRISAMIRVFARSADFFPRQKF
jgi:hypothetical protein